VGPDLGVTVRWTAELRRAKRGAKKKAADRPPKDAQLGRGKTVSRAILSS
jgi:hypothetical protein